MVKRVLKITRNVLIVLILLGISGFFAIQNHAVQSWLTRRVADYISAQLGNKVEVGSVEVDLWARLVINDLYIEDQHQDTLVFIKSLHVRDYSLDKVSGDLTVKDALLEQPYFNMKRYQGEKGTNLTFIVDYINSFSDTTDTTASQGNVYLNKIQIVDGRFAYNNFNRDPRGVYGLDWNRMDVKGLNLELEKFSSIGDSIYANIKHSAGFDQSGYTLKELKTELTMVRGIVRMNQAIIQTGQSYLDADLAFKMESIDDLDFFEEKVKMNHIFRASNIHLGELAYFVSDLKGWEQEVEITGKIKGRVASLKGDDIYLGIGPNTSFFGDFTMDGLPDIDQTFITADIKKLTTNKYDLDRIQLPPYDSLNYIQTPNNFSQLGQMNFGGNFTGFINDFVAYGTLITDIGNVSSDITLKYDESIDDYRYKGSLSTIAFDLGSFYNDKTLGPLTSDLIVEGKGVNLSKIDAKFDGLIPSMRLMDYDFKNITADGTFKQRFFDGFFTVNDEHLNMEFLGKIDFTQKDPILSFDSDINHMDLKEIGILSDFNYSAISGKLKVSTVGFELEKMTGEVVIDDLTYCAQDQEYYIEHAQIEAKRDNGLKLTLDSDVATGFIEGEFDILEIGLSMGDIVSHILPHYNPTIRQHKTQNFKLHLDIFDFSQISAVFIPELKVAPNTFIDFEVNEPQSYFEVIAVSDSISYLDNKLEGMVFDARRPDEILAMSLTSDQLKIGSDLSFPGFNVEAQSTQDTLYTSVVWGNEEHMHRGDVNGKMVIRGYENFDLIFGRSHIDIYKNRWQFKEGGTVKMDSTDIRILDFRLANNYQNISASGLISEVPGSKLDILVNAFSIDNLNPIIGDETKFYGVVSGSITFMDVYNRMIITDDLTMTNVKMNDYEVGDVCVESTWDNFYKRLKVNGEVQRDKQVPLSFAGFYTPSDKESPLDITAKVNNLDLSFINVFLGEDILDIQGRASGDVHITGLPEAPQLDGIAALSDASIYVYYLNTKFFIEEEIGILYDMFTFDHIRIHDEEGNPGFLTGQLVHNAFGDWNFDLWIDMESSMLAMNTTEEMNSTYFGKAYVTGYVNIFGYEDQLEFDISLKSEQGTRMAMPMGNSGDVAFESFIRFVDESEVQVEQPLDLSGIKLNLKLDITPDALFEIIFDEAVGDVMVGRGRGNLSMNINNLSTFNMYGDVELTEGNYKFTLKNLFNKDFVMKPGGTISWYGDPFAGELNMKAVYKVSASLSDILPDVVSNTGQRVPVDLVMNLTGKMFNPAVGFEIELPTVDEVTRNRVESIISTDQERNRQAFSLLVLRRFVSPPNITTLRTNNNLGIAENSTELLSSQISNWLSQISDDFNLGFNYRPGDDISNEEIALALSTQLFDQRLAISGNFGVARGTATNAQPTNLIGDIRIEYKITEEGKIRLVVYNESNDYTITTAHQSPYTQGVGVLYREEFDDWDQFICGFKQLFVKSDNRVECL